MKWGYKRYSASNGGSYCRWNYQIFWNGPARHWPIPVPYELWLQHVGIEGTVDECCNVYLQREEDVVSFLLRWS